jgi:hypothetical protein
VRIVDQSSPTGLRDVITLADDRQSSPLFGAALLGADLAAADRSRHDRSSTAVYPPRRASPSDGLRFDDASPTHGPCESAVVGVGCRL